MKGHISFINDKLELSKSYFKICEKFFKNSNYIYDLNLLYSDLYKITADPKYNIELNTFINTCENPRKNIVTPQK